jgi:hypothetical protein
MMLKWFTDHWDTIHPFLDERLEILEKKDDPQSHQTDSDENRSWSFFHHQFGMIPHTMVMGL